MKKILTIAAGFSLVILSGCSNGQLGEEETQTDEVSSTNPVTTPDGDEVGESQLTRVTNVIEMTVNACCVIPGNAYTAWWVIGDVTKSMDEAETKRAAGWVATSEQINLWLELETAGGTIRHTHDGVRIMILDHGLDSGDIQQIRTPQGGCEDMCPVVLETAHAAP